MKMLMTHVEAVKRGYKLEIDAERTYQMNRINQVIEQYATAELRNDPSVFSSMATLLGNFFFLLRIVIY
jgi:hypothetical protein